MIANSAAATYLYGTTTYVAAELFTIQATVGTLVVTTWPTTLLGGTPAVLKRGPFKMSLASEVCTCDLTIAQGSLMLGGLSICQSAARGDLDAASFKAERVLDPGGSNIRVVRFTGYVQQVEPGASELRIVAKDFRADMEEQVPARVYQPTCPYKFRSTTCGASSGSSCAKGIRDCYANSNTARFGGFPFVSPRRA